MLSESVAVTPRAGGAVTRMVDSAVHPLASVTLTVMVPAAALVTATEGDAMVRVAPEVLTSSAKL